MPIKDVQQAMQLRRAPTVRPTLKDISWAAGIFEGEGHSRYARAPGGGTLQITVTQKERWLCDRLQCLFGGSVYNYRQARRGYSMHYWKLYGPRARGFAMTVFAFLSPRRRARIRLALAGVR